MKTTITATIDSDLKNKVMNVIQNEMHSSLSAEINGFLKKLLEDHLSKISQQKNEANSL